MDITKAKERFEQITTMEFEIQGKSLNVFGMLGRQIDAVLDCRSLDEEKIAKFSTANAYTILKSFTEAMRQLQESSVNLLKINSVSKYAIANYDKAIDCIVAKIHYDIEFYSKRLKFNEHFNDNIQNNLELLNSIGDFEKLMEVMCDGLGLAKTGVTRS